MSVRCWLRLQSQLEAYDKLDLPISSYRVLQCAVLVGLSQLAVGAVADHRRCAASAA